MKASYLVLAALSATLLAAHAETPDPSGQFATATRSAAPVTRVQVQSELDAYKKAGVNPWSTSYNPLKSFKGERTRAEVQAEYQASRDAVSAMTAEDSGSAYLAKQRPAVEPRRVAGEPTSAQ